MQATLGDNTTDRPMWAERGGIDFDGRASWCVRYALAGWRGGCCCVGLDAALVDVSHRDAWTAVKGMAVQQARLSFVKTYYEFSPKDLYSDGR